MRENLRQGTSFILLGVLACVEGCSRENCMFSRPHAHRVHTRTNVVTSSLSRNCNDLVWREREREREREGGREMLLSLHVTHFP